MAWYPGAEKMELQPESDEQPAIVPTQVIFHSIAAPWTPRRMYEYWRDSTNLESHFGVGYDGSMGQFIGTQTRADANMHANRRPDGTGAVSIETASNDQHTDPWTPEQLDALVEVGTWLARTHSIPVRICRSADDPGFGYHRLFPDWSDGGTACPGDARVMQFHTVILPRIAMAVATADGTTPPNPEEDPLAAFTEADLRRIVREEVTSQQVRDTIAYAVDYLTGPKADARAAAAPALLLDTPMPGYAALPDGYRPTVGEAWNGAKSADAQLAAQAQAIRALVEQIASGSGSVDVDAVIGRIESVIEGIRVVPGPAS
jgi:hypothetical protein